MAFEIIKSSRLRTEIERMLVQGVSPRKVSEWTKQRGEYISHVTITGYKNKEFNFIKAAVTEGDQIGSEDSQVLFEQGKRGVLHDIEFCNKVLAVAEQKIQEYGQDPAKVHQFKTMVDAGIKAIDMKLKISSEGVEHESGSIHVNINQLRVDLARYLREVEELETLEAEIIGPS